MIAGTSTYVLYYDHVLDWCSLIVSTSTNTLFVITNAGVLLFSHTSFDVDLTK